MKTLSILLASVLMTLSVFAEDTEEWLNKHAAIKTTEVIEKDGLGNTKSVKVTKETTVYIKQTITEINKPDKNGNLVPISRTTVSTDIVGGSTVIVESVVPGTSNFTAISITTTEKTPEGLLTTVYGKDKSGNMSVISKTLTATSGSTATATVTL